MGRTTDDDGQTSATIAYMAVKAGKQRIAVSPWRHHED